MLYVFDKLFKNYCLNEIRDIVFSLLYSQSQICVEVVTFFSLQFTFSEKSFWITDLKQPSALSLHSKNKLNCCINEWMVEA